MCAFNVTDASPTCSSSDVFLQDVSVAASCGPQRNQTLQCSEGVWQAAGTAASRGADACAGKAAAAAAIQHKVYVCAMHVVCGTAGAASCSSYQQLQTTTFATSASGLPSGLCCAQCYSKGSTKGSAALLCCAVGPVQCGPPSWGQAADWLQGCSESDADRWAEGRGAHHAEPHEAKETHIRGQVGVDKEYTESITMR